MKIFLIIAAVLLFLLFMPLILKFNYEGELSVYVGIFVPFLKVFSTEAPKKKKKRKKKKVKPQQEKAPINKQMIWDLIKKIPHHMRRLLTVTKLKLHIRVGNEDPADLAMVYGSANAIVDTAASVLSPVYPREKWNVEIIPDFQFDRLEIKGIVKAYTNLWRIISVLISVLFCGILSLSGKNKE